MTSLSPERLDARALYEDFYCARGDMENRIKEQQLDLFADRTSAATMRANQLRLYLSSAAYMLMHALRRLGLRNTDLARAQCGTIRLKLLKIGAQVRLTVRHIWAPCRKPIPTSTPSTSLFEIYKRFLCVADRHGPHIRLASIASAQVCLRASRHAILSPTMRQLTLFDSHKSLTPAPSAPLPS